MTVGDLSLGQIIKETGDCGRFQVAFVAISNILGISVIWSLYMMVFTAATPGWQCVVYSSGSGENTSASGSNASSNYVEHNVCRINGTACDEFIFDPDMKTAVSEWELVCDRKWIPKTITTIQFVGLFIGGFAWGHVSDILGRKPTYFTGLALICVFNAISYFSVNWEMFAAMRFCTGLAVTACIDAGVLFEYIRNKWRIYLYLAAAWAVWTSVMALTCWQLHDWHYLNLIVAAVAGPSLVMWFVIPESFRWLVSNGKLQKAENVINYVARINGRPGQDLARIRAVVQAEQEIAQKTKTLQVYSALDLLRGAKIRKITILFSTIWAFSSFSYYGIAFGVEQLSGNLYMNMFLSSIVDLPGYWLLVICNFCGGRRSISMVFYCISGILALVVGVIQFTGEDVPGPVINWLAFGSKLFVNTAWELNMLWAAESLPTVVRNIGKGFLNSASRLGSILAPQIVSMSLDTPGLLYTVSGSVCLVSCILSLFLEETKEKDLPDLLPRKDSKRNVDDVK